MNPNEPQVAPTAGQTITPQGQQLQAVTGTGLPQPQAVAPQIAPLPQAPAMTQPLPPQPVVPIAAPLPNTGGGSKRPIVLIAVAAVVLIALAGGFLVLKGGGSSGGGGIASKLTGGNSDVQSRSDGKLDVSDLIDTNTAIKSQDLKAELNQQVNMSDGFSFMVTKIETDYKSPYQYATPDAGKQFIAVHVVGGNRMKEGTQYFSPDSLLKLKNAAGGLIMSEYGAASADGSADSNDLQPGEQKESVIVFSINPSESPIYLVYTTQYDKIGSSSSSSSDPNSKPDATLTGSIKLQ